MNGLRGRVASRRYRAISLDDWAVARGFLWHPPVTLPCRSCRTRSRPSSPPWPVSKGNAPGCHKVYGPWGAMDITDARRGAQTYKPSVNSRTAFGSSRCKHKTYAREKRIFAQFGGTAERLELKSYRTDSWGTNNLPCGWLLAHDKANTRHGAPLAHELNA